MKKADFVPGVTGWRTGIRTLDSIVSEEVDDCFYWLWCVCNLFFQLLWGVIAIIFRCTNYPPCQTKRFDCTKIAAYTCWLGWKFGNRCWSQPFSDIWFRNFCFCLCTPFLCCCGWDDERIRELYWTDDDPPVNIFEAWNQEVRREAANDRAEMR